MSEFKYKGKIFYQFSNVKSKETLVLLHGFSLDHRMWKPQIDNFKENYNTLVYDLRGFGKSTVPDQNYAHHDDLLHLLNLLELQDVHLIGLSMGGRVAVDFSLEHPEFVKSLALLDSSLGGYKSTVDFTIQVNSDMQTSQENWLSHQVFAYTNQNQTVSNILKTIVNDYSGWHWENQNEYEEVVNNAKDRLDEISCPAKILVGEHDLDYFKNIGKFMQERIKNSKFQLVPDSGHMSNLENPAFINDMIAQNLNN